MKLTETQIEELYKFTRKHYVEHYDVQTELVDHLANDIEDICTENPSLSFDKARDTSFKKFGVFGFMNVVEAKQKQLVKRYNKILYRFMKEWFSLPKVILTLSIFMLFYTLISIEISEFYFTGIIFILAIVDVFLVTRITKKAKKSFKEKNKKFLLEDIIFRTGAFSSLLIFSNFFQFSNFIGNTTSVLGKCIIASLVTLAIIYSYVTLIVIPKKAKELLAETYPEYKMVK